MSQPGDPIPFVDLAWQHRRVAGELAAGFADVVGRTAFVGGAEVAAFEREFARASDVAHCVGVANGTDALELTMRALALAPGSGVVVPANTFAASAAAVVRAGLRPVFADVDPRHLLLSAETAEQALTDPPVTMSALLPVHLYGQLAPMTDLADVARGHGLALVEDAAQAQLARQDGVAGGGRGHPAAFSFYPGKNLGAYGDAGAVLCGDGDLAAAIRLLANNGTAQKYVHATLGFNSRLDTLQAVVLRAKLAHLEEWNGLRRAAADRYTMLLADIPPVVLPAVAPGNEHVWHLYVVQVPDRDAVVERLHAAGVAAQIHYPGPLHLEGAFAGLGYRRGDFPVTEAAAARLLSLPMFPGITEDQQARVAAALADAVGTRITPRPPAHHGDPSGDAGTGPAGPPPLLPSPAQPGGSAVAPRAGVHPGALCEGEIGPRPRVWANAHVMAGASVGADCNIGEGSFIESGARIGDRVTVKNQVLVWDGVRIDDDVFLGPGATFTNDPRPRSRKPFQPVATHVRTGASVGARAVVLCGVEIGAYALVGAGAVVTSDVPAHALVQGVPARRAAWVCRCGQSLTADLGCPDCGRLYLHARGGLVESEGPAGPPAPAPTTAAPR
jgi:dTDP-4-amino-4,6-dideoxygalactose transaminase/serine acetyltransferase